MDHKLDKLYLMMVEYFEGNPKRIEHFIMVHSLAKIIGQEEGLDNATLFNLEACALVHDIGIKKAIELYGCADAKLQEELGPDIAKSFLMQLLFTPDEIERICYIVGNHHSYNKIDGIDFQILVEADFLVNLHDENADKPTILKAYDNIFKTESGKKIARMMYHIIDF